MSELTHAWQVFAASGVEQRIISPRGGAAPVEPRSLASARSPLPPSAAAPSTVGATYRVASATAVLRPGEKVADLFRRNLQTPFILQKPTARTDWYQSGFHATTFHVGDQGVLLFDPLPIRYSCTVTSQPMPPPEPALRPVDSDLFSLISPVAQADRAGHRAQTDRGRRHDRSPTHRRQKSHV